MPEWLIERGIGETRAALVDSDEILEARIEIEGVLPAGTVVAAQLASVGQSGRNAIARDGQGTEYVLPRAPVGATEGQRLMIEIVREKIPGGEPWKRALARATEADAAAPVPLEQHLAGQLLPFPAPADPLGAAGWEDLLDEARTGLIRFDGGELRIAVTPAMTLIDVDGRLPPSELALAGAEAAARAIRRHGIGGSIGLDLPTLAGKAQRQAVDAAIDALLPQPFERTAMNGFGFLQIVRPRRHASLLELAADRAPFEARALLRRLAGEGHGSRRIVAHPAVAAVLEAHSGWLDTLGRQLGGRVSLRSDPGVAIFAGHGEQV